jgi:hypothetical protein
MTIAAIPPGDPTVAYSGDGTAHRFQARPHSPLDSPDPPPAVDLAGCNRSPAPSIDLAALFRSPRIQAPCRDHRHKHAGRYEDMSHNSLLRALLMLRLTTAGRCRRQLMQCISCPRNRGNPVKPRRRRRLCDFARAASRISERSGTRKPPRSRSLRLPGILWLCGVYLSWLDAPVVMKAPDER